MEEILAELALRAPVAAVAIYAIYRMSEVMIQLADGLVTISQSQNKTIRDVVTDDMNVSSDSDSQNVISMTG